MGENNHFDNPIDAAYINALVELVNACKKYNVKLDKVGVHFGGWLVTFVGFDGDAVCHDGSYGSPNYACFGDKPNDWSKSGPWETYHFPWDYGDVSVHSAEWIAKAVSKLAAGEVYDMSWEDWEED